jgi:hypothetical protein
MPECSDPRCGGAIYGGSCLWCHRPAAYQPPKHNASACSCLSCADKRARNGVTPLPTLLERIYRRQEGRASRWPRDEFGRFTGRAS